MIWCGTNGTVKNTRIVRGMIQSLAFLCALRVLCGKKPQQGSPNRELHESHELKLVQEANERVTQLCCA